MVFIRDENVNAVMSLRVYLFQFSTSDLYPLAAFHMIDILQTRQDHDISSLSTAISGPKLFVHFFGALSSEEPLDYEEESKFLVFDWITGDCIFVSYLPKE